MVKSQERVGFKWITISTLFQFTCQFLFTLMIAREVGPELVGAYVASMLIINMGRIFTELGFPQSLINLDNISQKDRNTSLLVTTTSAFFLSIFLFLLSNTISAYFNFSDVTWILQYLLLILLLNGAFVIYNSWLLREFSYFEVAVSNIAATFVSYICIGLSLYFVSPTIETLVIATISFYAFNLIFSYIFVSKSEDKLILEFNSLEKFKNFNFDYTVARIANFIALEADNFIIGLKLGPTFLGIYSRGYQLMTLPATLLGTIGEKVLFPIYSRQTSDKIENSLNTKLLIIGLFSIPINMLVYLYSDELVEFLLGEKWVNVGPVLQALSFAIYFRISTKFIDSAIRSLSLLRERAYIQYFYALIIILSVLVAVNFDLSFIAYAVVLCVVINYCLLLNLLRVKAKFNFYALHKHLFLVSCFSLVLGFLLNL